MFWIEVNIHFIPKNIGLYFIFYFWKQYHIVVEQVWLGSLILLKKVEVEKHICERIHKFNGSRFCLRYGFQLNCGLLLSQYGLLSMLPSLTNQQWYQSRWFDQVFHQLLTSRVFLTMMVKWRVLLMQRQQRCKYKHIWMKNST